MPVDDTTKSESLLEEDKNSEKTNGTFVLPNIMNENYFGFKETSAAQIEDDQAAMVAETGSSSTFEIP